MRSVNGGSNARGGWVIGRSANGAENSNSREKLEWKGLFAKIAWQNARWIQVGKGGRW
jgi:hypothetical protein